MKKNRIRFRTEGESLLKTNLQFGLVGLAVGMAINLLTAVFRQQGLTQVNFICNVGFSVMITLSIVNVVTLFQCYASALNSHFWFFVVGFYVCNLVGMLIGTEVTYLVVDLWFRGSPTFNLHTFEYRTNAAITFIVGTLVLLYTLQKNNALAQIQAKENDLIRTRQLQSEAELQALQSKINPHFLYNALNSVASLIHQDAGKAEEMTIRLSKLFRYSLNSARENLHPLRDELEILTTYLEIEQVRFGDRMRFTIDAPAELQQLQVPRFLIQPLVENAIKHGLKNSLRDAEIRIVVERKVDQLMISVYDNGSAFPEQLEIGYGLQSTYDKLKLLYGDRQDLQLVNSPKHIKITIPTAA